MELLKEETLAKKLITKWFWLYLFSFLIAPAGYLIRMIISKSMSVEEVWIIYSVIGLMTLLMSYHDLWLSEALQFYLPRYYIKKEYNNLKTIIFLNILIQFISSIILSSIIFFWSEYLANNYFHTIKAQIVLQIFSIYLIIINFNILLNSIFISLQDTFKSKFNEFIRYYVTLWIIAFLSYNSTLSLKNISQAWIIWLLTAIIISTILFIKQYLKTIKKGEITYNKNEIKAYIKYAIWIFISMNISTLFFQIDQQIILFFLWAEKAWIYSNYLSLFQIPNLLILPIFVLLFPITSELIIKWDKYKLWLMINFFYKYFSVFSLYIWFFFILCWKVIALILFWQNFIMSWIFIQYTWIFYIFLTLLNINFSILSWTWEIRNRAKIICIALISNIILNLVFIRLIWIYWALIASTISNIIMFYLSHKIISKYYSPLINYKYLIKNIIIWIIITITIKYWFWNIFIYDKEQLIHNIMYLLIFFILYSTITLIFNYKDILKFKEQIVKIRKK